MSNAQGINQISMVDIANKLCYKNIEPTSTGHDTASPSPTPGSETDGSWDNGAT